MSKKLIDSKGMSSVTNNLIDKISQAIGYIVTRETPKKIAIQTLIDEIKTSDLDPLTKSAFISNANKILKEYSNQYNVVSKAIQMLPAEIDSKNVDDDWISMFMEHVKTVSNEDFQLLWARILAGEFEKPNSYSLRTLECLKNLSKAEALVFQKLAKFVLYNYDNAYIFGRKEVLDKYNVAFSDILLMEECGLMSSQLLSFNGIIDNMDNRAAFFNDKILCLISNPTEEKIEYSIDVYAFTNCGRELLKAVNVNQNNEYVKDTIREIARKDSSSIEYSAHQINSIGPNSIDYSEESLI